MQVADHGRVDRDAARIRAQRCAALLTSAAGRRRLAGRNRRQCGSYARRAFMPSTGRSVPITGCSKACFNPAMVCEIAIQPVRRHDVDASPIPISWALRAAGI